MVSVASLLAKPFDPLGLLSPFILTCAQHFETVSFVKIEMDGHVTGTVAKRMEGLGRPIATFATSAI